MPWHNLSCPEIMSCDNFKWKFLQMTFQYCHVSTSGLTKNLKWGFVEKICRQIVSYFLKLCMCVRVCVLIHKVVCVTATSRSIFKKVIVEFTNCRTCCQLLFVLFLWLLECLCYTLRCGCQFQEYHHHLKPSQHLWFPSLH